MKFKQITPIAPAQFFGILEDGTPVFVTLMIDKHPPATAYLDVSDFIIKDTRTPEPSMADALQKDS